MFTVEQAIGAYMKLRAKKETIEAETKAKVADIKEGMNKLEAWLKAKADEDKVTSFKTAAGTAFLTTTEFANVADWDAMLNFVKENDAYDLLEKRVSKNAVRGYMDSMKAVPPGVNFGSKVDIQIRKPTHKVD
jgi:hypothetical protein